MKGFNRKRLIPSLAASVIVATATLAPLPSFLAAGHVYADADTTPRVEIISRAPLLNDTNGFVDLVIAYKCSGGLTGGTVTATLVQGASQSGSGVTTNGSSRVVPVNCDGHQHKAGIGIIPTPIFPGFNLGPATATVLLKDPSGATVTDAEDVHIVP